MARKFWKSLGLISAVAAVVLVAELAAPLFKPAVSNLLTRVGVKRELTIAFIDTVYAATADYVVDGTSDDVQAQQALNALPSVGGKLIFFSGNYDFDVTVSRAINNVTIAGSGKGTYFANNASTPLFSAGSQTGWVFEDFRTDAGYLTVSSDSLVSRVWNNTSLVGPAASVMVAAVDATSVEKAQALLSGGTVCDGTNDHLDLAAVDGGAMILSSGTFTMGADWDVAANTYVTGQGRTKTTIALNSHKIHILDVDYVWMKGFKVTGQVDQSAQLGAFTIQLTASHGHYFFDDIWVTATQGHHFETYVNSGITLTDITFNNCFADSPDGFGFILGGEGTPTHVRPRFLHCDVKNAGIGANRLLAGDDNCWVTGFDFAENPNSTVIDLYAEDCTVDGAWESGFHVEANETLVNARIVGCVSKNAGQKTGDPAGPVFGAGYYFGSGGVSLIGCKSYTNVGPGFVQYGSASFTDCEDYESLYGAKLIGGGGSDRIHVYNFRSYDSDDYGVYINATVDGDVIQIVGGGIYNSTDDSIFAGDSANNGIDINGVEIINPNATGVYINGSESKVQNCRITVIGQVGVFLAAGTNIQVINNRIKATSPLTAYDSGVIRPIAFGNNVYGSTNDIDLSNADTERIANNIDKNGAWAWVDNVQ